MPVKVFVKISGLGGFSSQTLGPLRSKILEACLFDNELGLCEEQIAVFFHGDPCGCDPNGTVLAEVSNLPAASTRTERVLEAFRERLGQAILSGLTGNFSVWIPRIETVDPRAVRVFRRKTDGQEENDVPGPHII